MSDSGEASVDVAAGAPRRSLTSQDITRIALVSALIIAARSLLRVPLHIPGHSGVLWMALLIVGKGIVRKPAAGTLIGLVTGIAAVALVPGKEGILTGLKYLVPGITVDLLTPLFRGRLDRIVPAALIAAAAHVAKLMTALIMGVALGIPSGFLALGLGFAAATHLGFGVLGGVLGAVVLARLENAGVIEKPRGSSP
jgi:ABC-type thiamin/hydroxymethylpyrimidine transport system permease subunit